MNTTVKDINLGKQSFDLLKHVLFYHWLISGCAGCATESFLTPIENVQNMEDLMVGANITFSYEDDFAEKTDEDGQMISVDPKTCVPSLPTRIGVSKIDLESLDLVKMVDEEYGYKKAIWTDKLSSKTVQ